MPSTNPKPRNTNQLKINVKETELKPGKPEKYANALSELKLKLVKSGRKTKPGQEVIKDYVPGTEK